MTANESLSMPTVNREELPDSEDTASNNDIPDNDTATNSEDEAITLHTGSVTLNAADAAKLWLQGNVQKVCLRSTGRWNYL